MRGGSKLPHSTRYTCESREERKESPPSPATHLPGSMEFVVIASVGEAIWFVPRAANPDCHVTAATRYPSGHVAQRIEKGIHFLVGADGDAYRIVESPHVQVANQYLAFLEARVNLRSAKRIPVR